MTDNYTGILLEEIRSQNQFIHAAVKAVGAMQEHVAKIPKLVEDVQDMRSNSIIIKAAVTENSKDMRSLGRRVTQLENAA